MKWISIITFLVTASTYAATNDTHTISTMQGVIVEVHKGGKAWDLPSNPYYVLDMGEVTEDYISGTNRWQEARRKTVKLRPSDKVTTQLLTSFTNKVVEISGYHSEGTPYKPSGHGEQYAMEPEVTQDKDGNIILGSWRPANVGTGFIVERIKEKKEQPNKSSEATR